MFPVAGIESLAGGDTGSEPYKGKQGQERWKKMRENVIREWEAEQAKKGVVATGEPETMPENMSNTVAPGEEAKPDMKHQYMNETTAISANAEPARGQNSANSEDSKLQKLKQKLFRH